MFCLEVVSFKKSLRLSRQWLLCLHCVYVMYFALWFCCGAVRLDIDLGLETEQTLYSLASNKPHC